MCCEEDAEVGSNDEENEAGRRPHVHIDVGKRRAVKVEDGACVLHATWQGPTSQEEDYTPHKETIQHPKQDVPTAEIGVSLELESKGKVILLLVDLTVYAHQFHFLSKRLIVA